MIHYRFVYENRYGRKCSVLVLGHSIQEAFTTFMLSKNLIGATKLITFRKA